MQQDSHPYQPLQF
jgi:hypothetical protein